MGHAWLRYRHVGFAKYVAFHDLDELIIPEEPLLLPEMCNRVFTDNVATMRIPSRYAQRRGKLLSPEAHISVSRILQKTRTKCIVRPEFVFEQVFKIVFLA
ncbi:unnamed protein product [Toxocara canis]|uniref:Glycosyltransferase family 92 protein n=1 Tax=Toxocara canis TaxID=6265 RepID=A0A183UTA1_TOXCA|nr:unnamed protein product [Toxocara canis]